MKVEWDPAKVVENQRKHGVDFADAALVLEDDQAITVEDRSSDEQRFVSLGLDPYANLVVVVYTWRGETARLISARRANRREHQEYGKARRQ